MLSFASRFGSAQDTRPGRRLQTSAYKPVPPTVTRAVSLSHDRRGYWLERVARKGHHPTRLPERALLRAHSQKRTGRF